MEQNSDYTVVSIVSGLKLTLTSQMADKKTNASCYLLMVYLQIYF